MAQSLVERRLAACVNILPRVRSVYRWQGKVEDAEEWLLVIKTVKSLYALVEQAIHATHHYAVPEVIALSVEQVAESYSAWLAESVLPDAEPTSH